MNSAASGGVALFGAFGEMLGFRPSLELISEPALYGYAGRQFDPESGLYYMRARMHDPAIGRFLSEDPIGFLSGDINFYRYVFNDPVAFTDSTGRGIDPFTFTVGAILGGVSAYATGGDAFDITTGAILGGLTSGLSVGWSVVAGTVSGLVGHAVNPPLANEGDDSPHTTLPPELEPNPFSTNLPPLDPYAGLSTIGACKQ